MLCNAGHISGVRGYISRLDRERALYEAYCVTIAWDCPGRIRVCIGSYWGVTGNHTNWQGDVCGGV